MSYAIGPSVSNVLVDNSEEGLVPAGSVEGEKEERARLVTGRRARNERHLENVRDGA